MASWAFVFHSSSWFNAVDPTCCCLSKPFISSLGWVQYTRAGSVAKDEKACLYRVPRSTEEPCTRRITPVTSPLLFLAKVNCWEWFAVSGLAFLVGEMTSISLSGCGHGDHKKASWRVVLSEPRLYPVSHMSDATRILR